MAQKIGLEVANGFIKVVSNDTEITYPNKVKQLTGIEFNVLGDLGVVYEYEGKQYILDDKGVFVAYEDNISKNKNTTTTTTTK